MDDLFKSEENENSAVQLQSDPTQILLRGGFRLTKWCSNSRKVLSRIPQEELAPFLKGLEPESDLSVKRALGVAWNTDTDSFVIRLKPKKPVDTNRQILSLVSSIYDPLGMVAPFTLSAKIVLEDIWRKKRKLDEEIPETELAPFRKWQDQLSDLELFSLPRFYRLVPASPVNT